MAGELLEVAAVEEQAAPKKRRNRKKKSKKKGADSGAAAPAPAAPAAVVDDQPSAAALRERELARLDADKLNPHAQLCAKVMRGAEDISLQQVEAALEEMWDLQLPYDEDEAVLKYIQSGGQTTAPAPAPATNGHANGHSHSNGASNGHSNGHAAPEVADVEEAQAPAEEAPAPKAMSMEDKLDMVADFQSLSDAVFALSEWVNKAAKPAELEDVCAAKKTVALPTIIRRVVADCEDDNDFETVILPEMMRLVGGVLERSGVTATAVAGTRNALKSSLQRARSAAITANISGEPAFANFPDRFAHFITSRLSIAVEEAKFAAGDGGAMERLEKEIDVLSAKISNGFSAGDQVADMLAKRQVQKSAAKKSSMVAKIAMNGISAVSDMNNDLPSDSVRDSQITKADIIVNILGPEGKQRVDLRKAELEALQSQVQDGEPADITARRASIVEYQDERETIATRIAEMRAEIDKLESMDKELSEKVKTLEEEISTDMNTRSDQAEMFNKRLEGATDNAKFGKAVNGLVSVLKSYDDALEQTISQSAPANAQTFKDTDNVGEIVSNKMDMFLFRARNYFVTEAECVDFLQARIEKAHKDIGELKIEIEECQTLGMTTTVGQMEDDLKRTEDQIVSDTNQVREMCDDASSMFDALVSHLDRYNTAAQAERLSPIHVSALQGIPSCISRLGIPDGERINRSLSGGAVVDPITHSPPKPQRVPVDSFAMSSVPKAMPTEPVAMAAVDPIAPPPPMMPAMTEQATTMPKFTWASAAPAAGKQSLLEIQQEELQSKDE